MTSSEAGSPAPKAPVGILAAQEQIRTMQEGDTVYLTTINGFDILARRTAERTQIEANIKVTVTCPAAVTLAGLLFALGAAGIALALLTGGGEVIAVGGFVIGADVAAEVAEMLETGVAFGTLVTFLARYVC